MSKNTYASPFKTHKSEQNIQYYPIVFQITPRKIRAGIAGDSLPLFISHTNNKRWNQYIDTSLTLENITADSFIDHTTQLHLPRTEAQTRGIFLKDLSTNQWLFNSDILLNDDDKIVGILERAMHEVFYSILLLNPGQCKIIIPEPIWFPTPVKKMLYTLLFKNFQTQSIISIPEPLLSCVSAGVDTALVIDIGWETTTIVPVYQHYILNRDVKITKRGCRWLHYKILEFLIKTIGLDNVPFKKDNHKLFDFLEDLVNASYVRPDILNGKPNQDSTSFKIFENVEVPNNIRYEPLESLLFSELEDLDEKSIIDLIIHDMELSIDCKSDILNNVIITGELSKLPGVKSGIIYKLRDHLPGFKLNPIKSLGPWVGASIYCSSTLMFNANLAKFGELKRDKFLNGDQRIQE